MVIKLKKRLFARNRTREADVSTLFNKTSSGLTSIMPLIITVFFTPALIASSLFSREIIVTLANLSLSLGYITNFAYRLCHNEVSKSELIISALALAAFILIALFLFPPVSTLTFLCFLGFLNQVTIVINLFFLIKHVVIPPAKQLIEKIAHHIGFDITERYFSKPPIKLTEDRFVIDQLLIKCYGYDSFSPKFKYQDLDSFNKLLLKLTQYINKYDESFFGYIKNKDTIAALELQITQLTTEGNLDASYTFIQKKLGYKKTKIQLLQAAEFYVSETLQNPKADIQPALYFFSNVDAHKKEGKQVLGSGLECLQKEIKRQQEKIDSLNDCLAPRQQ